MIVGMTHFTITAEDERKTLDLYIGLLGLEFSIAKKFKISYLTFAKYF